MVVLFSGIIHASSFLIPFDDYERAAIIVPEDDDKQYLDCAKEYRSYIHNRSQYLFYTRSHVKIRTPDKPGKLDKHGIICLGTSDNNRITRSILSETPLTVFTEEVLIDGRQYAKALLLANIDENYIYNGSDFDPELLTLSNEYIVKMEGKTVENGQINNGVISSFEVFGQKIIHIPEIAHIDYARKGYLLETDIGKRALMLFQSRENDNFAVTLFNSLLMNNPEEPEVKTYLMRLHYRLGEYEEALRLSPDTHWGRLIRAMSLIALDETDKAHEELKILLDSNPPSNIRNMALFWYDEPYLTTDEYTERRINDFLGGKLKDMSRVIEDLKLKIAADPTSSELHRCLGFLYWSTGTPYATRSEGKRAAQSANSDKNKMIRGLLIEALGVKVNLKEMNAADDSLREISQKTPQALAGLANPISDMQELYIRMYLQIIKKITELNPDPEMEKEISKVLGCTPE